MTKEKEIIQMYQEDYSYAEIRNKLYVSPQKIADVVRDSGIPMRKTVYMISREKTENVTRMYLEHKSYFEIMEATGLDRRNIRHIVKMQDFSERERVQKQLRII